MDDGISLVVGGSALGALATLAGSWLKARSTARRIEPQPLEVHPVAEYAGREANDRDHSSIFLRLSAVEQKVSRIEGELEEISTSLHRIDNKLDKLILHNARICGADEP